MWSKTKKALMERTADNLKKRVRYNFEVYTTNKYRWWCEMPVFYIYVDDELWFATNPNYYGRHSYAGNDALSQGIVDVHNMMQYIHNYLNVYSVKECLGSGNYILKMLTVLDRRLGKRIIKQLVDNFSNEPEWFRKFIILRAESEGVRCQTLGEENGSMGL